MERTANRKRLLLRERDEDAQRGNIRKRARSRKIYAVLPIDSRCALRAFD
jgi:hypothetical protein